jgi:hypothetical protein
MSRLNEIIDSSGLPDDLKIILRNANLDQIRSLDRRVFKERIYNYYDNIKLQLFWKRIDDLHDTIQCELWIQLLKYLFIISLFFIVLHFLLYKF